MKEGDDKLVRSCTVSYVVPSGRDSADRYSGGRRIVVTRSIQRLSVILPVEEQSCQIAVVGDKVIKGSEVMSHSSTEDTWSQKKERVIEDTDHSMNEDLVAEERTDRSMNEDLVAEERTDCQS